MENKNVFESVSLFNILTGMGIVLAAIIIYSCFLDTYTHSYLMVFLYFLLFAHILLVNVAFKKEYKEIVKPATACVFTISLVFHAIAFIDMLKLKDYYFFSGNMLMTLIGIMAILLLFLYIVAYVNHYRINMTNASNPTLVSKNRAILIVAAGISLLEAILLIVNANIEKRNIVLYLVLTYILFSVISLILISMEAIVNMFRTAREQGNLKEVEELTKKQS